MLTRYSAVLQSCILHPASCTLQRCGGWAASAVCMLPAPAGRSHCLHALLRVKGGAGGGSAAGSVYDRLCCAAAAADTAGCPPAAITPLHGRNRQHRQWASPPPSQPQSGVLHPPPTFLPSSQPQGCTLRACSRVLVGQARCLWQHVACSVSSNGRSGCVTVMNCCSADS